MKDLLESSGMNRRRFIAMSAISAGGLALGACGDGDGSGDAAPETSPAGGTDGTATTTAAAAAAATTAATATTGGASTGSLNIGMNSVVDGLTPFAIQGYVWSQMLGFVLYDPLIKKDDEGNLLPCLATEWDTSDPLKTVLTIRPGVTFHDGTPLTAKDVAYSIAARADETLIASTAGRPIMTPSQWVSAEAVDDLTVEVITTERVEFLLNPQPVLIVPDQSFGKVNFANEVAGTGPFKLKKFTTGSALETEANPAYWDGPPSVATLTFSFFSDPATAATGLRSGQVDGLYDVAPANFDAVSDIDGTVVSGMGTYAYWWICQMGKEPLDDPEVRKALRYCFDLEAINNAAFKGRGLEHSWNPFNLYPNASGLDADEVEFDPAKAKQILADLGKSDITVPILVLEGYPDGLGAAQVMQQSFQAAGITCEVEVAPVADWLERTYTNGTWEGITFNAGNLPSPAKNFYDYLVNPSSILSSYKEGAVVPEVAELYREINATAYDSPELESLMAKAEATIVEDAVALMGFGAPVSLVLPEGVSGVTVNGFGDVFWEKVAMA